MKTLRCYLSATVVCVVLYGTLSLSNHSFVYAETEVCVFVNSIVSS